MYHFFILQNALEANSERCNHGKRILLRAKRRSDSTRVRLIVARNRRAEKEKCTASIIIQRAAETMATKDHRAFRRFLSRDTNTMHCIAEAEVDLQLQVRCIGGNIWVMFGRCRCWSGIKLDTNRYRCIWRIHGIVPVQLSCFQRCKTKEKDHVNLTKAIVKSFQNSSI